MFAAVRIWQLIWIQKLPKHGEFTGNRIFGKKRWKACVDACTENPKKSPRDHLMELCFEVLHSAEWEDSPSDKTRTMSNMELATIVYIDERLPHMENWPIYVEDKKNPGCMVGIEQVFDVVLLYSDGKEIRYIGTIDGLIHKASVEGWPLFLDENKTAARLEQSWRSKFELAHQVTGYSASSTAVFGFTVYQSRVTGLKLKPNGKEDIYPCEPMERTEDMFQHWATWIRNNVELYEKFKDNWEHAERRTTACIRFFRTCALLPFCCDTAEGRRVAWTDLMVEADQSPSEHAIVES